MEGSKQTHAAAAVLPPSWLSGDSQPPAVCAFLHLSSGRQPPRAAAGPPPGVDPSRLIIIPDQPPSHLKSLREDLSRSSFLLPSVSFLLSLREKAHLHAHLARKRPPSSTGGLPVRKLSGATKSAHGRHGQRSELTAEAAEQLEGGSLLQDLVDVARPRGHTRDSLLAWKGLRLRLWLFKLLQLSTRTSRRRQSSL